MNRILSLALLLCCVALLAAQGGSDSLRSLPGAATQLSRADYQATLAKLQPLADQGIRNADLYYDLGVCHHHLGDEGRAVLNFLRALNIDSAHRQARENLDYINSRTPGLPQESQQPYLAQLFLKISDFFSLNRLALIFLVLACLTTLSLHLLFHYPPEREKGLPVLLALICAILLIAFGSALAVKHHRYKHNPKGVVLRSEELRSAPAAGRMLKELVPGTTIIVKQSSGAQLRVILPDGLSGWIDRASFEPVVPKQKN